MTSLSADAAPEAREVAPAARVPHGDLASIQHLRALAAIGVLVFHAADRTGWAFGVGGAGVDVFFVISGLIMWVISARRPPTPGDFLRRRAARIVPLYWLVTMGLAGAWLAAPGLFPNLKPTPEHVIQSLLFVPHLDPDGVAAPLVAPGWTLNYEVFFYLVFALVLAAPGRMRIGLLTAILGALALVGLVLRPEHPIAAAWTSPLLLEFLAGVWLGKAWTAGRTPSAAVSGLLLALGVAALTGVALSGIDVEPLRVFLWGGPALLIVAGALGLEAHGLAPRWPALRFLGDASYSIYLVHALAISAALRLGGLLGVAAGPALLAFCIAVGVAAGVACYLVVERPLLMVFQPRSARGPAAVARPAACPGES